MEITLEVGIKETGATPLPEKGVEKLDDGLFRFVFESEAVMDIDAQKRDCFAPITRLCGMRWSTI